MRMIKRYPIQMSSNGIFSVDMPNTNRALSVGLCSDVAYLWAIVDPGAKMMSRLFRVVRTDEEVEDHFSSVWQFIGTVWVAANEFSFHVFEKASDR